MKRMYKTLVMAFAVVVFVFQGASAVQLGVPFGFGYDNTFGANIPGGGWGNDVGLRIHFTEVVAVQPTISFGMVDNNTNIGLNIDALFYLFESNGIRQYVGGCVGINITQGNNDFRLGGIYGLQYPIADAVDIFGQMGFGLRFEPGRFATVNTQLGVIFYIMK